MARPRFARGKTVRDRSHQPANHRDERRGDIRSLRNTRLFVLQRPESTELEPRDDLGYGAPMLTTAEPLDGRTEGPRWSWMAAGLGALTAATLLLEIVITRIFSVVLLYHFAFMAVSLALFGIGLAGIVVYLYPERFRREALSRTAGILALLFGLSTVAALGAFHVLVATAEAWPLSFGRVMSIFLVMSVPFFLSGLAVAAVISRATERIGFLYGADLCGAALGAALSIPVLALLGGPMAVVACAAGGAVSALALAVAAGARGLQLVAALGVIAGVSLATFGSRADLLALEHSRFGPEKNLMFQKWNSFSRVSVWGPYYYGSWWRLGRGAPRPALRDDNGQPQPTHLSVVIDGGAKTPMARFDGKLDALDYFRWDVAALGYRVRRPKSVLVIGAGAGRDILTARLFGVDSIRAVEINPLIVDVTRRTFASFGGDPYGLPGVSLTIADGRSFAAQSQETFDVVQLTAVDTFAASGGGALALVEHSLYTVEAFRDYHDRLSPDGILTVTHKWGVLEPERALRMVDLIRRAWTDRGHADVSRHVVVVGRDFAWGTVLVSRAPFRPEEIEAIASLASELGFGLLYAPDHPESIAEIRDLLGADPERFLGAYSSAVAATTDDRPYFFFFDRPGAFVKSGLAELFQLPSFFRGTAEQHNAPTLLVRLLVWMTGASLLLMFLVPMILGRLRLETARGAERGLLYFAGIGLGFITIEIPMIQRYGLLLGQPIYAFAVILGCVLVASGVGSLLSSRIADERLLSTLRTILVLVAIGAALHAWLVPSLIAAGLRWTTGPRLLATFASIVPLALLMGFPMPLGIRMLERNTPRAIAWAWGINGSLSVLGSIVAMMVSVTVGITATMLFGAAAYLLSASAAGKRGQGRGASPSVLDAVARGARLGVERQRPFAR
jgi:spermidine synthase